MSRQLGLFLLLAVVTSEIRADDVAEGRNEFVRLCSACHGADASGGERGPTLRTSHSRPADQIKQVIRQGIPTRGMPGFNIAEERLDKLTAFVRSLPPPRRAENGPSPLQVLVRLRDGRGIEGTLLNESAFDLQVQSGVALHSLKRSDVASIDSIRTDETTRSDKDANVLSFERIARPKLGDWPTYNGNIGGNRHSPLDQINTENVGRLAPRWIFPIRDSQRLEVTPVVVDGTMYVTAVNQVYALDAATGRQLWHFRRDRTKGLAGDAAGGINRGVAVLGDRVFLTTDHAHLLAIDRTTGTLVWETEIADYRQNYGTTAAPLVVNDLVISGVSGGDEGVRGFLAAYRADTGERVWQFWTMPLPGEPAAETWQGEAIHHGCSATWLTGTYDPDARLLYWTTGNPCPDYNGEERKGDNLYSNSVVALDPETGKLQWYFQFTPHDLHDWDAVQTPVLIDAQWQDRPRKLLLHANRSGFFYVLDRLTGEFLLSQPFAKQTWAAGIDKKGRPLLLAGTAPTAEGVKVCPAVEGATNWFSPAYNPTTGLYYVMSLDKCSIFTKSDAVWKAGESYYGGDTRNVPGEPGKKVLRAINVQTGAIAWEIPQVGRANSWGGVLSTGSGLVFYCDDSGAFAAADARTGKPLWHFHTNALWKASPMTYSIRGNQFVSVAAGGNILAFGFPD